MCKTMRRAKYLWSERCTEITRGALHGFTCQRKEGRDVKCVARVRTAQLLLLAEVRILPQWCSITSIKRDLVTLHFPCAIWNKRSGEWASLRFSAWR